MNLLKRRNRSSPLGPSVHSSRVSRLSRLSASKPVRQRPWLTLVLVAQLLVALHLARRSGAYTRKKRQACRAQSGGGAAAAVPVPGGDCAAAAAAIPKIIHQSYKSLAELPAAWQHVPGAWRETHPDYEYRFWSVAELLCRHVREGTEIMVAETPNAGLTNAFFAARPQSRVLEVLVWSLSRNPKPWLGRVLPYFNVMLSTGSTYFWRTVARLPQQDAIAVLPFGEWKPCSVCDGLACRERGDPVVRHIEGSSWHRWDGRFLLFLFCRWEVLCWIGTVIAARKLLAPMFDAPNSMYLIWTMASAAELMLLLVFHVRRHCST